MKLNLKNIGKIKDATVEIKGITVIAGENNTGKSTVGKALYAVFNSFYDIENQIERARKTSLERIIDQILFMVSRTSSANFAYSLKEDLATDLIDHAKEINYGTESAENFLNDFFIKILCDNDTKIDKAFLKESVSRVNEIMSVKNQDMLKLVIEKRLLGEFNGQVCNIFSDNPGEIRLTIQDKHLTLTVYEDRISEVHNPEQITLNTEAIYIDDPFVLDEYSQGFIRKGNGFTNHRRQLYRKLISNQSEDGLIDEIIAKDKLSRIMDKVSSVCNGDVVTEARTGLGYRKKNSNKVLNVQNLSTGLKTFVILKMLLLNGTIERNGTIILDEPEIHLHPEWQLLFAELIVLIQKEFSVHVLLNTHSPYFLNAIEVYAAKYGIYDKCKYYLARSEQDGSYIDDVTDHIDKIYEKLARPLQDLENEGSLYD